MDNILEQIQSLTDKFNNLFEVEGLGEPSGDVPPSTNKIKKDKKTKDGKVELVSVEDELFPKEGNAKEQFRQKIIDKINGMIQGTATLEDLLQLVRSKQAKPVKEGFEGVIEILEDILGDINRSNKSEKEKDKLYDKIRTARGKELVQSDLYRKRDPHFKSSSSEIRYSSKKDNDDDRTKKKREEDKKLEFSKGGRPIYTRNGKLVDFAEGFEGAIEILEEIINEVSVGALARAAENNFNKRRDVAKDSTEKSKKAHDSYEKQSKEHPEDEPALYHALSKLSTTAKKAGEKADHNNDLVNLKLPKNSKVSANKLFKAADKTYDKRQEEVDKALEKGKGRGDKEFDAPMKKFSRAVDLAVADPVVSRRTNGGANESFEQAINILETVLDAIKKSDKSNEKKSELKSKLINARDKERELANKKAWDSWVKGERKFNTTDVARTETKNTKGERKTRLRSPNNNYRSGGFSKTKPEWKQVEDSIKRHEKKVASESFEQAIKILEEIINEVSVGKLSRALDNSVEKRQKEAQTAREKAENAPKGSNSVLLNAQARKANRRSQDAQVLKSLKLPKDSKVSANKLFKSAEKALPHRENEVTKNSNSSSYSRYRRAWDIADTNPVKYNKSESFEQAIAVLEDIMTAIDKSSKSPERKEELKGKAVKASAKERKEAVKRGQKPTETENQAMYRVLGNREEKEKNTGKHNSYVNPSSFKNENFEQAISQIKELIDCLGESKSQEELSSVAKKVLPQREENARKAHDELNKVTNKLSPYNMLNGKFSQRQRETVANALNKAEKADSKVAHAKSYLEKPKEKQQTGMRFDKILCSCEEELNASKEILENLYKGINKKVNKGELSVSDALRLEKKVQDTISPEKRKLDGKELEAEMKNSLEPEIQVNKTLKALRRNDKKNNQGKANYKFTFDYKPVEEAIRILELFDRPDLIDDISKCLTKKTVKQHLEDTAKKIINSKKK